MAVNLSPQQDLFSHLVANHSIQAGNGQAKSKIAIERLELHLGHPSGVRLAESRVHALSTVRRQSPIYLLPPRPPSIVDRSAELETLRQSVVVRHVVDLHGPNGAGKSTLAAALMHEIDLNRFPDGAVFVRGHIQYQDLLQALFDIFYASDTPVKITLDHTHTYLNNLRLLVVLDDLGLGPKQIDPVLDALGESAVLVVGPERTALGRGRAIKLKGLPRQAAVEVFKQVAIPPPATEDALFIDQICILLNDMPLSISGVAAQAAQGNRSLTQILTELQNCRHWAGPGGDLSVGPSLEQIVLLLDGTDRKLLTLIAGFAGSGASSEAIRGLMNLAAPDFHERVNRLQDLHVIRPVGAAQQVFVSRAQDVVPQRLGLNSAYAETVRSWLLDDVARQEVVNYYVTRLGRGDRLPGDELWGLLGAIEDCAQNGWLDPLQPLVSAADRSLAELRWWAEWRHLLDLTRRASQSRGDRAQEAWAIHQLGTVLGALGEFDRSIHLLRTGLGIREALGDAAGAELTAQNLGVVERLMPGTVEIHPGPQPEAMEGPEEIEEPPPEYQREELAEAEPSAAGRTRWSRVRLALLAACVVLLLSTLAISYVTGLGQNQELTPSLAVSWEFGDAWNALDNQTWTQQVKIVIDGEDNDFRYFADNEPVAEMFEIVLSLCDGAQGTIRVESGDGRYGTVDYAFDSPYCR